MCCYFKDKQMNLQLSLKKKWFEMTKLGIKTEDYREITSYWVKRLFKKEFLNKFSNENVLIVDIRYNSSRSIYTDGFKNFTQNTMTLGYPKSTDKERILKLEHKGIEIRTGNPEWGAEPNKLYFVIKHGVEL
jgi:hypothetical protein